VTLSVILLAYTGESIATTFVVTAGIFDALAFWGATTKRSLASVGQFMFMGLIGLILGSVTTHHAPRSGRRSRSDKSRRFRDGGIRLRPEAAESITTIALATQRSAVLDRNAAPR
jgi:hypothetical protein